MAETTSNVSNVMESLKRMGVPLAYGEKVELGDSSLIPVVIAGFGFGEGEGNVAAPQLRKVAEGEHAGETGSGHGNGAGGGGFAVPVGAYVSDEFGTRFRPNVIALLVAVLPLACVAGWALPKLVKALKK